MSEYDENEYESFDLEDDEVDDDDLDEDDDLDDEDEDDDFEDATDEDIDLIVGFYREDGEVVAQSLTNDAANDLDELIAQLRRLPGDAGAAALVSLAEEVFCAIRVRGRNVQVMLSDGAAANDWPLARDVADYLNVVELPDEDDDPTPIGDLALFADLGLSEFDLTAICDDFDEPSDQQAQAIADRVGVGRQVRKVIDAEFG